LIAVIPARKNSRRFPGKNRATYNGKSFLELALASAVQSGVISEVFLSSDDEMVIDQAKELGITVPFKRASELSQDDTSTWSVVIDLVQQTGYVGDLCLLQLTSPKRLPIDVQGLFEVYSTSKSEVALTVRESSSTTTKVQYWLCPCSPEISHVRHCRSSVRVVPNGSAYMLRTESLVADPFSSLLNVGAHLMPADRSLDIDYEYQLVQAFDSNTDR
jgi:CMP-N-acetylneuraminic acid synthetase|tara:strand:- start:759 stop:1409 length:651 start_codon:yes stop_codon:yes gene_type:complete